MEYFEKYCFQTVLLMNFLYFSWKFPLLKNQGKHSYKLSLPASYCPPKNCRILFATSQLLPTDQSRMLRQTIMTKSLIHLGLSSF